MKRIPLFLVLVFVGSINILNGQNVKILDLTSNTYSSGSSFYVNIGSQMQVTDTWTFEGWIYVDSRGGSDYPVIMDRRTVFSMYLIDGVNGGDYAVRFVARNSSGTIIASLRCDGVAGSTATAMDFDKWYHVAVSRDGTTARMFIDGNEVHSSTDPDFVLSTPSGNAVNYGARYWGSYERFLDGALDEMRYSDIARYTSDFTINKHSSPHPTSGDGNTILLFNFDNSDLTNSTDANTYTATAHGTLTYSDYNALSDDLPLDGTLPLNFISFSANKYNSQVQLNWETAFDITGKEFEVQRSIDLKNWQEIGAVAYEKRKNTYTFIDKYPQNINYYRIKAVNFDGNFSYSKTLSISNTVNNVISVFPNPVKNIIFVSGLNEKLPVKYAIYDTFGKKLEQSFTNGIIRFENKKPGLYYLQIKGETKKFIVK